MEPATNLNPTTPPLTTASVPPMAPKLKLKRPPLLILMLGGLALLALILGILYFLKIRATPKTPEVVTIIHWGIRNDPALYQDLIRQFELEHPEIKINYQAQSNADYRERLQTALSSDNGPDVFSFHQTWPIMLQGLIAPIPATVIPKDTYRATLYPINDTWLVDGRGEYLGLPLEIDGLGLYLNNTLLTGAGLNPPTSWAQLRDAAKTLTIRQENQLLRGGIAMGTTNNVEYWPDIIGTLLFQNQADPANPNTKAGQDVLTFYTQFVTKDKVWDQTMPPSTYAFAHEKAAMMIAPASVVNEVYEENPTLSFSVVPLPQTPNAEVSWATYWAQGVSAKSNSLKQDAAWKWLLFLIDKETLRQAYAYQSTQSLVGKPFSRVDMADQLINDPYLGAFLTQAKSSASWYLCSHTEDNGLNDRIIALYETALTEVLDGEPPDEVLLPVTEGIEEIMAPYQKRR